MSKMATATKNAQNNKSKNDQSKKGKPKANQNNNKTKNVQNNKPKSKGSQHSNIARNVTIILTMLGIGISVFALYIEVMKENNPDYVAFCDINSYISCSKVLTSKYGKGFGIVEKLLSKDNILNQPNPVYGIAFYVLQALLALKTTTAIAITQTLLCIAANVGSVYLGYILFFILGDLCVVCLSTYVINFLLLVISLVKLWQTAVSPSKSGKKKKK